jgi:hypothetical protein
MVCVGMADFDHDKVTAFEIDHISLEFLGEDQVLRNLAGIARIPETRNEFWRHLLADDLQNVPSVGLVVAGDAAYKDVHLYLMESNTRTRQEWISALDTIEELKPRAVIAGHKKLEKDDGPRIIEETRQYIRDFERVTEMTTTAREFYDKMLELYPDRANPGSLGQAGIRLCNLVAQGPRDAEGTVQTGGRKGTDRAGNRALGNHLLEAVQEPDPGH